jgi:Zn-dependent M28 family amino/carboxypeptidase
MKNRRFFFTGQQGSLYYARKAKRRGDDIRLMISLETIGYYRDEPGSQKYPPFFRYFYPDCGNFIAFVSNLRSRPILRRFVRAFRSVSSFPFESVATFGWIPGVAWSDHRSFWRQGFQALMVTDTAFYRYPYYHRSGDTAEKLDYHRMAMLAEGLYSAVLKLAEEGV